MKVAALYLERRIKFLRQSLDEAERALFDLVPEKRRTTEPRPNEPMPATLTTPAPPKRPQCIGAQHAVLGVLRDRQPIAQASIRELLPQFSAQQIQNALSGLRLKKLADHEHRLWRTCYEPAENNRSETA